MIETVEASSSRRALRIAVLLAPLLGLGWLLAVDATASPGRAFMCAAAVCVLAILAVDRRLTTSVFLGYLCFLLLGYSFFGRGFAYIGLPPVYLGEIGFGIALVALLWADKDWRPVQHPLVGVYLLLATLGAVRTVPYLRDYGAVAVRDAAIWGYGIMGVALATQVTPNVVKGFLSAYRRVLPLFLVWVPIGLVFSEPLRRWSPSVAGVPLASLKAGDLGVHLAGCGAFLLLGLHRAKATERPASGASVWLWFAWVAGFIPVAALSRGGLLAIVAALGLSVAAQTRSALRRMWPLLLALSLIVTTFLAFDVSAQFGSRRAISAGQIAANIVSIGGSSASQALEGSRSWRLAWWQEITKYTFNGDYFWTGKGFGINLADADGFQVGDRTLRSPHNGHLTILARMGVPGLTLWLTLVLGIEIALAHAARRARGAGDVLLARTSVWLMAYLAAFLVNAAFDVFLEGPRGGIWFWCLFGLGLGAIHLSRRGPHAVERLLEPTEAVARWGES